MGRRSSSDAARPRLTVICMLLALLAASCSGATAEVGVVAPDGAGPPASLPLADLQPLPDRAAAAIDASVSTTTSTTTSSTLAPDPFRTWIATARDHVVGLAAHEEPGGAPLRLPFVVPNPHQFGGALTLMVVEGGPDDDWVRVQLPIRPNGQEGWIRTADYSFSSTRIRAEVDLSDRRVVVYDGDVVIAQTNAVVGTETTPTPLGRFFVAAKKENSDDEYFLGPWALVLSGYSEALDTFSGGLPVIAVHGTHRPEQVGQSLSNGCIRVPNEVIEVLADTVPLGAPVNVSI